MQTNVRVETGDEQVFVYSGSNTGFVNGSRGEAVVAVRGSIPGRQFVPDRLGVVQGGKVSRRSRCRNDEPTFGALRNTLILGTACLLLLIAYSLGASWKSGVSPKAGIASSSASASYVVYTVKPGDTPWSIASRMGTTPKAIAALAGSITSAEAGAVLMPGTVLFIPKGAAKP